MLDAYLAFETGGTKLVAAVADAAGRLIESRVLRRDPCNRAPQTLAALMGAAGQLRVAHEACGAAFKGIGFGYGGQVHRAQQRVLRNLHEDGWEDMDVRDALERVFGLPSVIENDCKLAALAEAHLGAGRGQRTVFYMTIGTGIGGGIVREGSIVDFGDSGEAEIGHLVVMPQDGFVCGCGNRGCLETVASGPGLVNLARKLAQDCPTAWQDSAIARRALHDARFTAADLFEAYAHDDAFAGETVHVAAGFIAQALAGVIQIVNPDAVVIGGGVGTSSERFIRLIAEQTHPLVMPSLRGRCRFVMSQLREQVVTQGAALLAARTFGAGQNF
ncbi:MAG: ROK family protein [Anaerolineae bacterium]|nr:ROK family protein [Candidatus Roseilinea sp.]MDW8451786.1 ROK family protein [Anaerolineae bacterium]